MQIFPISRDDQIRANNLNLSFSTTAKSVATHLQHMGYIYAKARFMPLNNVNEDLSNRGMWDANSLVHKDLLVHDPINFLLNGTRHYAEIPDFPYVADFFEVPLPQVVTILNIVLARYPLIHDAPEPFMRINKSNVPFSELQRLHSLQDMYFRRQAEKIADDDSDNIDYEEACDYEAFDEDLPVVACGIKCGSYVTTDTPSIESKLDTLCNDVFDFFSDQTVFQMAPIFVAKFSLVLVELLTNSRRSPDDVHIVQQLKDEVFKMPIPPVAYVDYLLSTPLSTRGVMCNTPSWTLVRQYNFFLAPKGAGKSTCTRELQGHRIGVFEDEHLMKLVPFPEKINKENLELWRVTVSQRFIILVTMALARGDHIIWSLSNFMWFANRYKWLRGVRTLILDVCTVFQHPNQSETELRAKKKRDSDIISNLVDDGYPYRHVRTLACALQWNDMRSHNDWLKNNSDDASYIDRFGYM